MILSITSVWRCRSVEIHRSVQILPVHGKHESNSLSADAQTGSMVKTQTTLIRMYVQTLYQVFFTEESPPRYV